MRYRQNTKGDILYGPPVSIHTNSKKSEYLNIQYNRDGRSIASCIIDHL